LPLTPERFEALLKWLAPDREAAGKVYINIQTGLISMFAAKGFSDAEGMADDVINRVADRLPEIGPDYDGKPVNYFRRVAHYVILEGWRRKEIATGTLPEHPTKIADVSDEYECLLRCLRFFSKEKRELILDYHVYEGGEKIANHRLMAEELSISENALRVQAHRVRVKLEKCVRECVAALKGK